MEIKEMLDEVKSDVLSKLGVFTTDLDGVKGKFANLQTQVDCIDAAGKHRHFADSPAEHKSVADRVLADEGFLSHKGQGFRGKESIRILVDGGLFPMGRKSTITDTGLGSGTSGVLMPQRLAGLVKIPQQGFRIRDLITVIPQLTSGLFDFVRQSSRVNAASPQIEAAAKAESTYSWVTTSDRIRTIAHFTNVSRQALDDNAWLRKTIDSELMYGLLLKEESQILSGSGTGEDLNGIITQATAYASGTYNVAGDTKLDILRHAKLQARLAGLATYAPDGIIVSPVDMEAIELLKTNVGGANTGLYIVGDPKTGGGPKFLWDLPAVESDSITPGTFLVGSFGNAVTLIDRMTATIDISFEHNQNFTQNLATILCECRIGLAVTKPSAFIYGSY